MKKAIHFQFIVLERDAMQVYAAVQKQIEDGEMMPEPDITDFEGKTYFEAILMDATVGMRMPLQTPFCGTDAERRRRLNELLREINKSLMEYVDEPLLISKPPVVGVNGSRLHIPG